MPLSRHIKRCAALWTLRVSLISINERVWRNSQWQESGALHYSEVTLTYKKKIADNSTVCSTACWDQRQRKQSPALLLDSSQKVPVKRLVFPCISCIATICYAVAIKLRSHWLKGLATASFKMYNTGLLSTNGSCGQIWRGNVIVFISEILIHTFEIALISYRRRLAAMRSSPCKIWNAW